MKFLIGSKESLGVGAEADWSWSDFAEWISSAVERSPETMAEFHAWPKDRQSAAKQADWISGGKFREGKRQLAALEYRTMFTLDIDECSPEALEAIVSGQTQFSDLTHCGHATRSSTPTKPRLRLYFPCDAELDGETYRSAALALCRIVELLPGVVVDTAASTDPARLLYQPTLCADAPHVSINSHGSTPDTEWLLATGKELAPKQAQEGPLQARRDVPVPNGDQDLDHRGVEAMRAAGAVIVPSPRRKGEMTTNCPWHDDQSPSLDIAADGKMVCRAGCKPGGQPITWLRYVAKVQGLTEKEAFRWVRRAFGLPESSLPPRVGPEAFTVLSDSDRYSEGPQSTVRRRRFESVPVKELERIYVEPEDKLWGDYIVRGEIAVLAGEPGIGKSTFTRSILGHIAWGKPFLGVEAGKQARILVADYETSKLRARGVWENALGSDDSTWPDWIFIAKSPDLIQDQDGVVEELIEELVFRQADLLVIDTLSAGLNIENENDNAEVGRVVRLLKRICESEARVAILVLHHPSKGGSDLRGAQALKGGVDNALTFKVDGELGPDGPDESTKFRLNTFKVRYAANQSILFQWDGSGGFVEAKAYSDSDLKKGERMVIEVIRNQNGMTYSEIVQEVTARGGIGAATAKRAIRDLKKAGAIESAGGVYCEKE